MFISFLSVSAMIAVSAFFIIITYKTKKWYALLLGIAISMIVNCSFLLLLSEEDLKETARMPVQNYSIIQSGNIWNPQPRYTVTFYDGNQLQITLREIRKEGALCMLVEFTDRNPNNGNAKTYDLIVPE